MDIKEILQEEINKLHNAIENLSNINIIDCNSNFIKKQMQAKLNKSYSSIVDVKMDLEKIVEEMEVK
jgi:hypothetical protein